MGGDGGLDKVRDRALAGEFRDARGGAAKREQRDVLQGFAERCSSSSTLAAIAPLQVVLDGANGMAGHDDGADPRPRLPIQAERCHF